jgi:hypothetical protein
MSVAMMITSEIKLNRGPVAQDHSNYAWTPKNIQKIAHMATDILII